MAEIRPFRGLRYDENKVDLASVLTLPYDVISPRDRERYYLSDPHNIVRIILGRDLDGDHHLQNRYTRSCEYFKSWCEKGIVKKDELPCIYRYDMEYEINGLKKTRRGFLARLRLSDFEEQEVLPHENTFDKHREDRLKLLRTCNANFSPIFTLYEGDGEVERALKDASTELGHQEILFGKGVRHQLWPISDPEAIVNVRELLVGKQIFIADGHHRYETALMNAKESASKNSNHTGEESYNFILACLTSMNDEGLTIYPTHRVIRNISEETLSVLPSMLSELFDLVPKGKISDRTLAEVNRILLENRQYHCFGMLIGEDVSVLKLKKEIDLDKLIWKEHSPRYKRLDVTILHEAIIERFLGKDWHNETDIAYLRKEDQLIDLVKSGEYQVAFFLNTTRLDQMKEMATSGEIMPPKSTYFYPKLLSGIVINELD